MQLKSYTFFSRKRLLRSLLLFSFIYLLIFTHFPVTLHRQIPAYGSRPALLCPIIRKRQYSWTPPLRPLLSIFQQCALSPRPTKKPRSSRLSRYSKKAIPPAALSSVSFPKGRTIQFFSGSPSGIGRMPYFSTQQKPYRQ